MESTPRGIRIDKMKKIMILGASILQLPAIKKALSMGLCPIVVDMNPDAIGFKEPKVVKEVISTIDTEGILSAAEKHHIDGIMTLATDMPMRSVAVVAHKMGLVGISEDCAFKATNKAAMRNALKSADVPIPLFFKVSSLDECRDAVRHITEKGYKCITKPVDSSGSRGIDLLKDYSEESVVNAYTYSNQNSRTGEVMVEEFMEGPEVSVETIAIGGEVHVLQITDKITTGAPYFVEMGHTQPSSLPVDIQKKIMKVAIAANKAIGITNGPSHTEIKVTKDGPKIVELGARMGGDCITTHLVPLSTGIDMVKCCIQIAIGDIPDLKPKFSKGSAIRYFKQPLGKIKSIEGVDEIKNMPGVYEVDIVHGVGETVGEVKGSGDRIGFVIAQSDNSDLAAKEADAACSRLRVQTL